MRRHSSVSPAAANEAAAKHRANILEKIEDDGEGVDYKEKV